MSDFSKNESSIRSWVIVTLLVLLVLAKGIYAFTIVSDRGQPSWSYGTIEDVPGASPYAIYELVPYPQHIKGTKGE